MMGRAVNILFFGYSIFCFMCLLWEFITLLDFTYYDRGHFRLDML